MSTLSAHFRTTSSATGSLTSELGYSNQETVQAQLRSFLCSSAIVCLCVFVFSYKLSKRDMWSSHEARAAQNAVSVLEGSWLIPRLYDGRLELQKPPLYYWLIASWCRITGRSVDALAVRLPACLSALIIVVAILLLSYLVRNPLAGILAVIALLLMPHFLWLTHVGRLDMPLTACLSVALIAYIVSMRSAQNAAVRYLCLTLIGSMLAVGLMIKGPIVVVLFTLITSAHIVSKALVHSPKTDLGSFKLLMKSSLLQPASMMIIFLSIAPALLWYIAANSTTDGQWVREFIYRHNLARGWGGDPQLDRHAHWLGPLFYIAHLPLTAGLALGLAIWLIPRIIHHLPKDNLLRFSLCWFLAPTIFLSLMRYKRADYLLPAYPGLALFCGFGLARHLEALTRLARQRWLMASAASVAMMVGLWLAYLTWAIPKWDEVRQQREFASTVRHYVPNQTIYMYGTEAHLATFHVGKPVRRTYSEAELRLWLITCQPIYIVMPQRCFEKFTQDIENGGHWEILARSTTSKPPQIFSWLNLEKDEPLVFVRIGRKEL